MLVVLVFSCRYCVVMCLNVSNVYQVHHCLFVLRPCVLVFLLSSGGLYIIVVVEVYLLLCVLCMCLCVDHVCYVCFSLSLCYIFVCSTCL